MNSYNIREYSGIEDLIEMQELVSSTFDARSHWHIGDLAWQRFQHEGADQNWLTYLFEKEDDLVAWGWLEPSGSLNIMVHPSHQEETAPVVDHFSKVNRNERLEVNMTESEGYIISGLLSNGFQERSDGPFHMRMYRDLENLPEVNLPDGFSARCVDPGTDLEKRVDVHREAWHPSRVTYESYGNVMKAPGYSTRLDWIIIAPDGSVASYCLIWHDKKSQIGLLEPAGTSPRYRRLGLSRAVCTLALMELKKAGGKGVVVNPRGDDAYPVPAELYRSIGFRRITRERTFVKEFSNPALK